LQWHAEADPIFDLDQESRTTLERHRAIALNVDIQPNSKETMMKKLLIAATLTAAAVAATPLLAQTGEKPAQTAATEGCPMGDGQGDREARHAQMQARMQAMHAGMGMGTHEGRGPRGGEHQGHGRQ
jgi:hypothetical protein